MEDLSGVVDYPLSTQPNRLLRGATNDQLLQFDAATGRAGAAAAGTGLVCRAGRTGAATGRGLAVN